MTEAEKKLTIAVPGEWALQKVFGPVLAELGEDLKRLYAKGRDRILSAAHRKVLDPEDGKQANLRVARDVLWNGAFTDDEVCAEYFGGILASSRSGDGKDDHAVQFVDVVKSLSSKQLHLHYVVYNALNRQLAAAQKPINVGMGDEIQGQAVWFSTLELVKGLGLRIDTDLHILYRHGLLFEYRTDSQDLDDGSAILYTRVRPTSFGVLVYAAAHNMLDEWREFDRKDFGDFPDVDVATSHGPNLDGLVASLRGSGSANGQTDDQ